MESMVQRVIRQVKEVKLTDNITIATNAGQLDIIINQLGDAVDVVTEPERRDTFPAIALAASYLKLEKGCSDDEVIVIMPCDPYTENDYFETVRSMTECVEANVADLVLMGIVPTYPSEKFGYIVPENNTNEKYKRVKQFTEKPNVERAEELLKLGAVWNGGVFTFRLGYMMDIVRKYSAYDNFADVRAYYTEFPKISFDYEVAEKAKSVAVVPFSGQWKDLGTWNTLTDEFHHLTMGNVTMGPHCKNTHVINELHHPIYVDGLEDAVVAASPDGIIVCKKQYTEEIKKAVDNLTPRPMYEERRWGSYRVIDESKYQGGHHALTKSITLKPGCNISYQFHRHRSEVWTFVEGEGLFVLEDVVKHVQAGDTVVIPVGQKHTVKAISELTFIEVQLGNPLIEEDIERLSYSWIENDKK